MKIGLLVIDMQNDFCLPGGRLYVPGAEGDVDRLVALLACRREEIGGLMLTRDEHQVLDIAHPVFWTDRAGKHPSPFSVITVADLREGRWSPREAEQEVAEYLETLECQGGKHTIWPEHCIAGSEGAAIVRPLMEETVRWARQGRYFRLSTKGGHPLTEHYGIFRAEVPRADAPETEWNTALLRELEGYEELWVAGEAKSHCVAVSLKQLMTYPALVKKLVVLEDAMSPVKGYEHEAEEVFREVVKQGGRIGRTTELM